MAAMSMRMQLVLSAWCISKTLHLSITKIIGTCNQWQFDCNVNAKAAVEMQGHPNLCANILKIT